MALFTDTEQLSKYIPSVVRITDFTLFQADLEEAELSLKLDFLDQVYQYIDTDESLKTLCETFVANRAAISFIPQLDLLLTESGFVVTSNSNQTPASKERVEKLVNSCKAKTASTVEKLLSYIASKDNYYNDWKSAKYCCRFDDFAISTNEEFRKFAPDWNGRTSLDYRNLYSRMLDVTETVLKPAIGTDFYSYLIANPTDTKVKDIITSFKMTFAYAVVGNDKVSQRYLSIMLSQIIADRTEFPEFDSWYSETPRWENTNDNRIVFF